MITREEQRYLMEKTGIDGFSELNVAKEVCESVYFETGEAD
jgi:hypothetical protein